jgi:hypothetical protein
MAITAANINTGGAVVLLGGTVSAGTNADGFYDTTVAGTDVGCTSGGVTVTYTRETSDIFCDQVTSPVSVSLTGETATIEFDALETTAQNIELMMDENMVTSEDGTGAYYVGIGGNATIAFQSLQLKITDNDTGFLTYYTFFKTIAGGFEVNFERENPTTLGVTFTAYADTTHTAGKQLFQIQQNKS